MKQLRSSLLLMLLASFASPVSAEKIPDGGTIVIAIYDEPLTLNPLYATNGSASLIEASFTDGLTRMNEKGECVPDLAERWEVSGDGLTWTFYLQKDIRFSDGAELTADDVVFNYTAALDPKYNNSSFPFSQLVQSYAAESKNVFKIVLKAPYPRLAEFCGRPIVPARLLKGGASVEKEFEKHPIGTGPFMLTDWKKGQITLDANPEYFGGRPHLDRIVFKLFQDPEKAWTSLMQGTTDLVIDVDYENYAVIKDDTRFRTFGHLEAFCYSLFFNLRDPLFRQTKLRQALAAAIDRNDLIERALKGGAVPTTGFFMPGTWAYNPDPSIQVYDPAKASRLLADLGWKDTDGDWILDKQGKKLQFTALIDINDKPKEAVAKRLQWQLMQVGVRMDVQMVTMEELVQRAAGGKFQAAFLQINTRDPATSASDFWHSAPVGAYNFAAYSNAEVDRLIDLAGTTKNLDDQKDTYQRIHAIVSSDAPAAFLFYKKRYVATSARLRGIHDSAAVILGSFMNEWYVVGD